MSSVFAPVAWVVLLVAVSLVLGLVLEHGGDALRRVEMGAPPFPVIDGETRYPDWAAPLTARSEVTR